MPRVTSVEVPRVNLIWWYVSN